MLGRVLSRLRPAWEASTSHTPREAPSQTLLHALGLMTTMPEPGATKYYDSQSGRWMSVPGAAGIRIHERALSTYDMTALTPSNRISLLEKLSASRPFSIQLWEGAVGELHASGWKKEEGVDVAVLMEQPRQLNPDMNKVVTQIAHSVRCDSATLKDDLQSAQAVVKAAHAADLQVRAYVLNAFEGEDEDDNVNLRAAQEVVMSLADSGADLIVLSDCKGKAHEDSLRELVEEAFYLDVAGNTMLERLGVSASLENCRTAARLGVQHFDACAAQGARREGAQMADTIALLHMLQEEEKKCSMKVDMLKAWCSSLPQNSDS